MAALRTSKRRRTRAWRRASIFKRPVSHEAFSGLCANVLIITAFLYSPEPLVNTTLTDIWRSQTIYLRCRRHQTLQISSKEQERQETAVGCNRLIRNSIVIWPHRKRWRRIGVATCSHQCKLTLCSIIAHLENDHFSADTHRCTKTSHSLLKTLLQKSKLCLKRASLRQDESYVDGEVWSES